MPYRHANPSGPARAPLFRFLLMAFAALAVLGPASAGAGSAPAQDDHGAETRTEDGHGADAKGDGHDDENAEAEAESKETHPIMSAADYFSDVGRGGYGLFARRCQDCHGFFMEGTDHGASLVRTALEMDYSTRRAFHDTVREHALQARYGKAIAATGELNFNQIELIAKYLREFGEWRADRNKMDGKDGN